MTKSSPNTSDKPPKASKISPAAVAAEAELESRLAAALAFAFPNIRAARRL